MGESFEHKTMGMGNSQASMLEQSLRFMLIVDNSFLSVITGALVLSVNAIRGLKWNGRDVSLKGLYILGFGTANYLEINMWKQPNSVSYPTIL
jgi:hypothetical protein